MVQIEPAQAPSQAPPAWQTSENWLLEPSGVGPSETVEPPPPMFRPPQLRFLMRALAAFRVLPQVPPGVPVVNSRNAPPTAMPLIVVVVVEPLIVVVVVEPLIVVVVVEPPIVVVVVELLVVVVVVVLVVVVVVVEPPVAVVVVAPLMAVDAVTPAMPVVAVP